MNNIILFDKKEFGSVRTITEDNKVLFCGSDVAKVLGYHNPRKALSDHCKGVTKRIFATNGGNQQMNFISEGDVYRLIVNSNLPTAKKIESWIFDEVLPTIRRTGGYVNEEDLFIDTYLYNLDDNIKNQFRQYLSTLRQLNGKSNDSVPLAEF